MAELKNRVREKLAERYGGAEKVPSQMTLAVEVGLSQTTVSRWLGNKVDRFDADALEKWCRFFKCSVGDLIYFEGESEWLKTQ